MGAVIPVMFTTPDGVERPLRFTMGARRRMAIEFGSANIQAILQTYDYGAVPRMLYLLLFDEKGNPPPFSKEEFEESFPSDSDLGDAAIAAIMSAALQGRIEKKDLEAAIAEFKKNLIGSNSGALASAASDSPTNNSGDFTPPSSTPSPADTGIESESQTTAPAS